MEENKVHTGMLYKAGEFLLLTDKHCPVRDNTWVETMDSHQIHRAVRYGICRNTDVATKHRTYLRHAGYCSRSVFYRYTVPTGQAASVLNRQAEKTKSLGEVLYLLETESPDQFDNINSLYSAAISGNPTFFPERGVYESVSSSGKLELISDDLLKYRIANLYERYYTRLIYNGELYDQWAAEVDWDQREFVDKSRLRIRNPEALQAVEFLFSVEYLHNQSIFYTELA